MLLVNGPQYARNLDLSGSPMGFDSAQGDGFFRWRNETFGWKQTASNILRNAADQMGARSDRWNQSVYSAVLQIHEWIHDDVNDPATTWRWTQYEPPRNANHESNANNRWHLLILCGVAIALVARRTSAPRLVYLAGVLIGFLLFCFYLKWQPFSSRLLLPLFVLAAPVAGAGLEKLRPVALQWLLCLFLLNNSRTASCSRTGCVRCVARTAFLGPPRRRVFFRPGPVAQQEAPYMAVVEALSKTSCEDVAIDADDFQLEYPFQALLREARPGVQFVHTGVTNASLKYRASLPPVRGAMHELCREARAAWFISRFRDGGPGGRVRALPQIAATCAGGYLLL